MFLNKQEGSALVLTMIVIFVLIFLGSAFALNGMVEIKQAQRDEEQLQAYYLARTAADALASFLEENPHELEQLVKQEQPILVKDETGEPLDVLLHVFHDGCQCQIQSTGSAGNCDCTVCLCMLRNLLFQDAIFAKGENTDSQNRAISLNGGCEVIGDVATSAAGIDTVHVGPRATIDGELLFGVTSAYPDEFWPDFDETWPTADLTQIRKGYVFELGAGLQRIRIGEVNVTKDGSITIKRPEDGKIGRLELHVTEKFFMANGAHFRFEGFSEEELSPELLTIYYSGDETFIACFRDDFHGNILIKKSDVEIRADNKIRGSILCESSLKVDLRSGTIAGGLIYAPKAFVDVSSGVQTSAIVANRLEARGTSKLIYDNAFLNDDLISDIFGLSGDNKATFARKHWSLGAASLANDL